MKRPLDFADVVIASAVGAVIGPLAAKTVFNGLVIIVGFLIGLFT